MDKDGLKSLVFKVSETSIAGKLKSKMIVVLSIMNGLKKGYR